MGITVWGSNSVTGQDWNQYQENGVRNWHRNDGIGTEGLGPLPRPHLSTTVPPHTTEWGLCAVGRMRAEWEHSWCHPPPPPPTAPKGTLWPTATLQPPVVPAAAPKWAWGAGGHGGDMGGYGGSGGGYGGLREPRGLEGTWGGGIVGNEMIVSGRGLGSYGGPRGPKLEEGIWGL